MSIAFTDSQRRAIEHRDGALLVSAAAGSGKTKVLTERLLRYVAEEGADIDRFLVITFTRAAAGELRARIMESLGLLAAAHPGDGHLRRQQSLCCRAPIGTIHSFCAQLLREYSQALGLSPAFSVMDEERAEALRRSVLTRLLEQHYAKIEAEPGFQALADSVGAGRDDSRLEKTLLELHDKLSSLPYPADWAAGQRAAFALAGVTDAGETAWGRELLDAARGSAEYWAGELDAACAEIAAKDAKLQKAYGAAFAEAAGQARAFCRAAATWDGACAHAAFAFPRLGPLRDYDDPDTRERLKALWNDCKKALGAIGDSFAEGSEVCLARVRACAPAMDALLDLAMEFDRAYRAEKLRRAALDYSDLEHLTLKLLVDPADGAPTEAAREVAGRFTEIMVDEYQDVNAVQELIFRAISREGRNLFLVGDVKQSIYRFRLADPGLFLEKYNTWPADGDAAAGQPRRILLRENFRSRRPVLDAANLVFGSIMSRALGELDYDDDAALRYAAQGYDPALDAPVELHVIDPGGGDADEEAPAGAELEARFVAETILALMKNRTPVTENGGQRPCDWGDFALLLRAPGGKGAVFHRVLAQYGIPVEGARGGGFFSSLEVAVTIDLLAVIDNPHADVPLISVLRSPAFHFTGDELSAIRAADRESDYYGALRAAAAAGDAKAAAFLTQLARWRALAPETDLAALVWMLCTETGLLAICAAMDDAAARRRNLMYLFQSARSFSESGYRGVYRFVQWLRQKSERGAEPEPGGGEQAVRIMSIHRSKGLEFPFVFLCDLHHRFNQTDSRGSVLLHTHLGLGPKFTDTAAGVEYPTLARKAVARRLTGEMLSEEMRVLYVGMTRARERLYLSCVWKNAAEALERMRCSLRTPQPPETLRAAASFVPWIAGAALRAPETLPIVLHGPASAAAAPAAPAADAAARAPDEALRLALREKLDYAYPWPEAANVPSKRTATDLQGAQDADADDAAPLLRDDTPMRFRRADFGAPAPLSAAERGSAAHTFLQYVDFACTDSAEALAEEAERLVRRGRLRPEERDALDLPAIARLFASPLGREMRAAERVRREFRFLLLVDAGEFGPGAAPGDQVLLQGVVDCCFVSDGAITVVDYKTDRVTAAQVPERAERYRGQVLAYARALREIFSLPVKRCVLWFLHPGAEFVFPLENQ